MAGTMSSTNAEDQSRESSPEAMKVLIIGDREALESGPKIRDSLAPMGFDLNVIGVVYVGPDKVLDHVESDTVIPVFRDYEEVIAEQEPDVIIVTSDDHELRQKIMKVIPPRTRFLDSFALQALFTLKTLSGELGTTQDKLKSVELIKEVLMAGSEVSIMVVNEDFKVLDINNAILKRTKMAREGCIGRDCHWVVHRSMEPCHQKLEDCVVLEVLRTGKATHSVREERRADGRVRYFTRSAYPLKEDERGKKSVLIVWKDVSKGMAPVLDRQVQSLRENFLHYVHQDKMTALGKLAAAAVHEINNPIQGILTFSKLMRMGLDEDTLSPEQMPKYRTYLDLIAGESARCGQILRNLLSFARQGDLRKSRFHLNNLVDEVILLTGNRMELQGISLCREIDEDLRPVYGDRNQIKQALLNLILNAVEAMPKGGIISIAADPDPETESLRISISDTGPGVAKEHQSHIFEPFVTTKQDGKGVGLGLSVVYGIVTQHGGSIRLESEEDKGATFIVNLPVFNEDRDTNSC